MNRQNVLQTFSSLGKNNSGATLWQLHYILYNMSLVLEINLAACTEYAVGTGEGIADTSCGIVVTIVVVVHSLEVSSRQGNVLLNLVAETKAKTIAVDNE